MEWIDFSPDGKTAATGGYDNVAKLWDVTSGRNLAALAGHNGNVMSVRFSPDGKTLATAGQDKVVRLWDVASRQQTDILDASGANDDTPEAVLAIAYSPDRRLVATAHEDKSVRLRNAADHSIVHSLVEHDDIVAAVAFSPDGKTLATASYDRTIKLWDISIREPNATATDENPTDAKVDRLQFDVKERSTLTGHTNWVFSISFSPDGKTLASSGYDKTIRLWDVATGKLIKVHDLDCGSVTHELGHGDGVTCAALSPDGQILATGCWSNEICLWDTATSEQLAKFKQPVQSSIRSLTFSADGKVLVSGCYLGHVRPWRCRFARRVAIAPKAYALSHRGGGFETTSRFSLIIHRLPSNCATDLPQLRGHWRRPHLNSRGPCALLGHSGDGTVRRIILRSFQSPGDVLILTAAVRDLHAAAPGQFQIDVRTSGEELWQNNPHLTPLSESDSGVETLDMHYPLIDQSNQRPYHFLHGFTQYLEQRLGLRIPVTRFHGDVHLSDGERHAHLPSDWNVPRRFWIIIAGGKYDFTAKWWNPDCFQQVVDHFCGDTQFVQCGEAGHWHPPLEEVVNLVGQTSLREFVQLMYHADGVLCPVTMAMHLAAAVETKPGRPKHRPCVVVAGGREPPHWEAYPFHQYISNVGTLSCCADGGCWKSRCQPVGDGDEKDRRNLCEQPVKVAPNLHIPRCMDRITPHDVIRRIEMYSRVE